MDGEQPTASPTGLPPDWVLKANYEVQQRKRIRYETKLPKEQYTQEVYDDVEDIEDDDQASVTSFLDKRQGWRSEDMERPSREEIRAAQQEEDAKMQRMQIRVTAVREKDDVQKSKEERSDLRVRRKPKKESQVEQKPAATTQAELALVVEV